MRSIDVSALGQGDAVDEYRPFTGDALWGGIIRLKS